jgi:hypothetical protein
VIDAPVDGEWMVGKHKFVVGMQWAGTHTDQSVNDHTIVSSAAWMHRSSGAMDARTACDSVFETTYVRAWGPLSSERDPERPMKSHSQSEVFLTPSGRGPRLAWGGRWAMQCMQPAPVVRGYSGFTGPFSLLPALPLSLLNWRAKPRFGIAK